MCKIVSGQMGQSKSHKVRAWTWVGGTTGAALGTVTICQGKNTKKIATYAVSEHAGVPFPARGFRLAKVAGGSDPEATNYDVKIDPADGHTCECRGFHRWGHCSHIDALVGMIAEEAMAADPENPASEFPHPDQVAADAPHDLPPDWRYAPVPF